MSWVAEVPAQIFHETPVRQRADVLTTDQEILVWQHPSKDIIVYEGTGEEPLPDLIDYVTWDSRDVPLEDDL